MPKRAPTQSNAPFTNASWRASSALLLTLGGSSALLACAGSHESERPHATAASEPARRDHARLREQSDSQHSVHDRAQRDALEAQTAVVPAHDPTEAETPAEKRAERREHAEQVREDRAYLAKPADDTGLNERDRGGVTPTPIDQGNARTDIELTAQIRRAVVSDDALSFAAKNVKIITSEGKVTLRGPVKSAQEKSAIETYARQAAGTGHVKNDLEISP